jgi:hypothetical protein
VSPKPQAKTQPKERTVLAAAVSLLPDNVRVAVAGLYDEHLATFSEGGTMYETPSPNQRVYLAPLSVTAALRVVGSDTETSRTVVALARVPRILVLAKQAVSQQKGTTPGTQLDVWRNSVVKYYHSGFGDLSDEQVCWVVAATSCHWIVEDEEKECVPGTDLTWRELYMYGVVCRGKDGQFSLLFCALFTNPERFGPLSAKFTELFGVQLPHAVLDLRAWFEAHGRKNVLTDVGDTWEYMFNACLVLRYHLLRESHGAEAGVDLWLSLSDVYASESAAAAEMLGEWEVCLSEVKQDASEGAVEDAASHPRSLRCNKSVADAHHDAILPARKVKNHANIVGLALQHRFSTGPGKSAKELLPQLLSKKKGGIQCRLLHCCPGVKEKKFTRRALRLVSAFKSRMFGELSGRGCINNDTVDTLLQLRDLGSSRSSSSSAPSSAKRSTSVKRKKETTRPTKPKKSTGPRRRRGRG